MEGLLETHGNILKAVSTGALPVPLARDMSAIVEAQRRLVETAGLETRLAKLEEKLKS